MNKKTIILITKAEDGQVMAQNVSSDCWNKNLFLHLFKYCCPVGLFSQHKIPDAMVISDAWAHSVNGHYIMFPNEKGPFPCMVVPKDIYLSKDFDEAWRICPANLSFNKTDDGTIIKTEDEEFYDELLEFEQPRHCKNNGHFFIESFEAHIDGFWDQFWENLIEEGIPDVSENTNPEYNWDNAI